MNTMNIAWTVIKQQYSPQAHMMQGQAQKPTQYAAIREKQSDLRVEPSGQQLSAGGDGVDRSGRRRYLAGAKAGQDLQQQQQNRGDIPNYQQEQATAGLSRCEPKGSTCEKEGCNS